MDGNAYSAWGQSLATRTALFLCTGNYYRSRFAEVLFNRLANGAVASWRAESRGLAPDKGVNVGPISPFAREGLRMRGIELDNKVRFPLAVTETDLAEADLIVALKETEHRPMLARQFPDWVDRVEYWQIDDLDVAGPEEALAKLEAEVVALLRRLRG